MEEAIRDFWEKEPFTTYLHQHGKPTRLATEWHTIRKPEAIPVLKKIGCEVDEEGMRVRKTILTKAKWKSSIEL